MSEGKTLIGLVAFAMLCGSVMAGVMSCDIPSEPKLSPETEKKIQEDHNRDKLNNISYFEDPRVGICYASVHSISYGGYDHYSITTVNCNTVRHLLGVPFRD